MNKPLSIIFGAGGHARVLIDTVQKENHLVLAGLIDNDPAKAGGFLGGIPIIGSDKNLTEVIQQVGSTHFLIGVGSVGNSRTRVNLFEKGLAAGLQAAVTTHPGAIVADDAQLGPGCMVFAGAIINPGTCVGMNTIINTRALVEHDVRIEQHAHLAPGCIVLGHVTIGQGCHIGAGSVIREGLHIGDHAIIGAGAVVVKDVPSGTTVFGVPAKEQRTREDAP